MVIKQMRQEDVGKVLRYIKKYFGDFPDYYNKDYLLKNDTMYLIALNSFNSIIGLVSLNRCEQFFEFKDCFEIGELIVSEDYRGVGLSSLLVHELLNYIPFDKEVYVSAWGTINDGKPVTHAKNALERNGFHMLRRDMDYYAKKGDCKMCINRNLKDCKCYNDIYMFTSITERYTDGFDN